MDEKNIPEVNNDELKDTQAEVVENTEEVIEEVKEETAAAEEAVEETVEEAVEETETADDDDLEPIDISEPAPYTMDDLSNDAQEVVDDIAEVVEAPVKKKFPIQIPVIIAACIVVLALLGYLVYTGFFLKEPEGVTWATEIEGATYYYDFKNDGTFNGYVGSAEITGTYEKTKGADGNQLTISSSIGNFYGGYPCTYEITGSRILGNQVMSCSYGEGYDFTLNQSKREKVNLEVSNDFTPDEALVGTWIFKYMGYDVYKVTFDAKGYMSLEFLQQGIKYNGTYTIEDGVINFTYVISENVTAPGEYSVDGDVLNYMGYAFVREGSDAAVATNDQIKVVQ